MFEDGGSYRRRPRGFRKRPNLKGGGNRFDHGAHAHHHAAHHQPTSVTSQALAVAAAVATEGHAASSAYDSPNSQMAASNRNRGGSHAHLGRYTPYDVSTGVPGICDP